MYYHAGHRANGLCVQGYVLNQVHTLAELTTYVLQKKYLLTYVKFGLLTYVKIRPLRGRSAYLLTYLLTCLFTHSLTHLLTYLLNYLCSSPHVVLK